MERDRLRLERERDEAIKKWDVESDLTDRVQDECERLERELAACRKSIGAEYSSRPLYLDMQDVVRERNEALDTLKTATFACEGYEKEIARLRKAIEDALLVVGTLSDRDGYESTMILRKALEVNGE